MNKHTDAIKRALTYPNLCPGGKALMQHKWDKDNGYVCHHDDGYICEERERFINDELEQAFQEGFLAGIQDLSKRQTERELKGK